MWYYNNKLIEDIESQYIGFVYLITNLTTGKKYVGKKRLKFSRTKQVKGKKIKFKIDSDWKTYYGSSGELLEDLKLMGPENFKREILYFCKTLGECSYLEAKEQIDRRVLETDDYYNNWIQCKISRSHLPKNLDKSVKSE